MDTNTLPATDGGVPDPTLGDAFATGDVIETFDVMLSNEVVHLLSEQLYTSPLKAIEEIVVNAYDADASECRVGLLLADPPDPASSATKPSASPLGVIAVFDDGDGMDVEGLRALWKVGISPKSDNAELTLRYGRKPIGKFGIGKLATYAVANRITYVTSKDGAIHHVTCDFRRFANSKGKAEPVKLEARAVGDLGPLLARVDAQAVLDRLGIQPGRLVDGSTPNWTLCLLDALKPKARDLKKGRLSWVLRTAMPLRAGFRVFLDGEEQKSSKENQGEHVRFKVGMLETERLAELNKLHSVSLVRKGDDLVEPDLFPSGIKGEAFVTEGTLIGKSDAVMRSHGFFIRVHGRIINMDDALFHNTPISYGLFNRFRADLEIDDLHDDVTAPREGVGLGRRRDIATAVAREIALQARSAYEAAVATQADQKLTPEETRVYVAEHLVERPVADALAMHGTTRGSGADVDQNWVYMQDVGPADLTSVIGQLYEKRTRYNFKSVAMGREGKLARFDPARSLFMVNEDHQLVQAFSDDPRSKELLDLLVTAEVLLEVYMVESGLDRFAIGEVLGRRDTLLRSLAQDRVYSREAIVGMLRQSGDDAIGLELAVIAAVRSLGFQVKHIGGAGKPDGIARFLDTQMTETLITVETKASQGTPQLGALDFAGLFEHKKDSEAAGCFLVAPSYPAQAQPNAAAASRAKELGISCWTIEQLVRVVEAAEEREITSRQVADIVTSQFSPVEVATAVEALFARGAGIGKLYAASMRVLRDMFRRRSQKGDVRKVSAVTAVLTLEPEFEGVSEKDVRRALADLASQSKGGMQVVNDEVILFLTDFEEVTRRVAPMTGDLGSPRSLGTFKA